MISCPVKAVIGAAYKLGGVLSMRTPLRAMTVRGLMLFSIAAASVFLSEAAAAEPQNIQPAAPGDNLVTSGRLKNGIVACEACHRPTGEGDAGSAFSNLTGLTKEYIAKQLSDFQSGARESRVMQVVAQNLSAAEIEALSSYYASLPPLPLSTNIPEAPQIGIALAETGDAKPRPSVLHFLSQQERHRREPQDSGALRASSAVPQKSAHRLARRLAEKRCRFRDGGYREEDFSGRNRRRFDLLRQIAEDGAVAALRTPPSPCARAVSAELPPAAELPARIRAGGGVGVIRFKDGDGHAPGSAQTFAELARGYLSNPETDRAPGSCPRAPGSWTEAQPAPRSAPPAASHI